MNKSGIKNARIIYRLLVAWLTLAMNTLPLAAYAIHPHDADTATASASLSSHCQHEMTAATTATEQAEHLDDARCCCDSLLHHFACQAGCDSVHLSAAVIISFVAEHSSAHPVWRNITLPLPINRAYPPPHYPPKV